MSWKILLKKTMNKRFINWVYLSYELELNYECFQCEKLKYVLGKQNVINMKLFLVDYIHDFLIEFEFLWNV